MKWNRLVETYYQRYQCNNFWERETVFLFYFVNRLKTQGNRIILKIDIKHIKRKDNAVYRRKQSKEKKEKKREQIFFFIIKVIHTPLNHKPSYHNLAER